MEFLLPQKHSLNIAEEPRRACSSRIEPIVKDDHLDLSSGEGEGEGEKASEEVGSTEVRDRSSSRPSAMSVSKSMLGLEGSEWGGIVGYSASPSTCTSISKSTSNQKSSDSDENEQALPKSKASSQRESENTEEGRPFIGRSLRDEDEAEAGVCDTREWKEVVEVVGQYEDRCSSHKRR